ncbi:MAG: FixH family protein [Rhodospirillales bacterium]|nr:FixH family protein [Rhodospirillales bacterium]
MSSPVLAQAVKSKTQCKPTDAKLTYECTVMLMLDGKPVTGADIMVKADMPAMPMAHNVKPVPAKAMHHADGQYSFQIELEMFGEWKFTYDLAKPFRDRLGEKIMFSSGDPNEMKKEKMGTHRHN